MFIHPIAMMLLVGLSSCPFVALAKSSANELRQAPLGALAQKLLGEAGLVMIDMDRPRFEGVLESVKFYSHATVTGSQFGICGADWVTVNFDEEGSVEGLDAQKRYGVADNVYRKPGSWTYEESERICRGVKSTRTYFPAPGAQSALEMVWYVDAIAGRGPFAKQAFSYSCSGWCGDNRDALSWLKLDEIDDAKEIDCPKSDLKYPSCFEVSVGHLRVGPFPKRFKIFGTTYMNKVVVTDVLVDVGSTLE
jgi:hypothetical protein